METQRFTGVIFHFYNAPDKISIRAYPFTFIPMFNVCERGNMAAGVVVCWEIFPAGRSPFDVIKQKKKMLEKRPKTDVSLTVNLIFIRKSTAFSEYQQRGATIHFDIPLFRGWTFFISTKFAKTFSTRFNCIL